MSITNENGGYFRSNLNGWRVLFAGNGSLLLLSFVSGVELGEGFGVESGSLAAERHVTDHALYFRLIHQRQKPTSHVVESGAELCKRRNMKDIM